MPGYFAACPANAVDVGSIIVLFSCDRGIVQCTPSLCTVRCSFSSIRSAPDSRASSPYRTPPHFPFFSSSFGDTTARTPALSSGPPFLSFISPSVAHAGSATCPILSPPPVRCFPSPFSSIKSPWTLFFFFIPFPRIRSRATKSSRRCEARFGSLR